MGRELSQKQLRRIREEQGLGEEDGVVVSRREIVSASTADSSYGERVLHYGTHCVYWETRTYDPHGKLAERTVSSREFFSAARAFGLIGSRADHFSEWRRKKIRYDPAGRFVGKRVKD